MAKEVKTEPKTAKPIGSRDWRGQTVFFCQVVPGCPFDSESEAVVRAHIATGNHRGQTKAPKVKAAEEPREGSDD